MTPLPKKKRSATRQTNRRLAFSWQPEPANRCPNCQEEILPHTVCPNCGQYRGRQLLEIKEKAIVRKVTTEEAK